MATAAAILTCFHGNAANLPRPAMQYSANKTQTFGKNGTKAGRKGIAAAI